jgi:hypothetical protein
LVDAGLVEAAHLGMEPGMWGAQTERALVDSLILQANRVCAPHRSSAELPWRWRELWMRVREVAIKDLA